MKRLKLLYPIGKTVFLTVEIDGPGMGSEGPSVPGIKALSKHGVGREGIQHDGVVHVASRLTHLEEKEQVTDNK